MTDDDLRLIIQNLVNSDFGNKYLKLLIDRSECLDTSISFDNVNKLYYSQGKKKFGLMILEDIQKYSPNNYLDFIRKG